MEQKFLQEIYVPNQVIVIMNNGECIGGKIVEITKTGPITGGDKIVPLKFLLESEKKMELDIKDIEKIYEQDNI